MLDGGVRALEARSLIRRIANHLFQEWLPDNKDDYDVGEVPLDSGFFLLPLLHSL